jgi:hypothetical protein
MFDGILEHWDIGTVAAVEPTSESGGKTWFVHTGSGESFVMKLVQQIREWAIPTIEKHGSDVDFLSIGRQ